MTTMLHILSAINTKSFMEANKMNPDHGSSLIWVHIVCTIGYLWLETLLHHFYDINFLSRLESVIGEIKILTDKRSR